VSRITRSAVVATFVRSFLIQAAWNYRTMLGAGFGFSLLPGLRRVYAEDPDGLEAAVERHLEHFNAHPYLSGIALGAVLRLEDDGVDEETVRRFKVAVRGPLGSLGDRLVWATWLPLVAMASLVLYWLGAGWVSVTVFFLAVYNAGHLGLRAWGLRVGLEAGRDVAGRLASARIGERSAQVQPFGALLVGALVAVLLVGPLAGGGGRGVWVGLGAAAFIAGLAGGHRIWRPAAVGTVVSVCLISLLGVLR
jgi:mannose/fructose/N-acetylgalactosamine-specific phosphotransferase system component IID